jgi:dienelactone hydrolase
MFLEERRTELRHSRLLLQLALLVFTTPASMASELERGVVIPEVSITVNPSHTYALYLPAAYSAQKRWPVIFALDPEAKGVEPVKLMAPMAEKYGYIVLGSNVSRNGPMRDSINALQEMWKDAHERFRVDEKRRYLTGYSGGARVAVQTALLCKGCVAGVIGHGSGFPDGVAPSKDIQFVYFGASGLVDYNFPEMQKLEHDLDKLGVTHRTRFFPGGHEWATAEIWPEIFAWIELQAMKRGLRERDQAFVREQYSLHQERVRALEASGDLYSAYQELRRTATDFNGLAPTEALQQLQKMEDDKRVKAGGKQLQGWLELQAKLVASVDEPLQDAREGSAERKSALARARMAFQELYERAKKARQQGRQNDPEVLLVRRAAFQALALLNETGRQAIRDSDPKLAIALFDITAEIVHSPGAYFERARAFAMLGKNAAAFADIKQALASGVTVETVCSAAEFKTFLSNNEFLLLLGDGRSRCQA